MDKVLSLLGLARKAGRLSAGFDLSAQAAREGRAALLAAAADVSPKTYKNLCYEADRAGIPAVRLEADMRELSRACGVKAGVLAVTDQGFAQAALKELDYAKRKKEEEAI